MQLYFGTDQMHYTVSSTGAGVTINPRHYERFSQAQLEVVEARILQGIHFRSADEDGRQQGLRVAHWTFMKFLGPVPGTR